MGKNYAVYIVAIGVGSTVALHSGYGVTDWEYWAIIGSIMVARLSGL